MTSEAQVTVVHARANEVMNRLLVEAPDPDSALVLVNELKKLHAELLPGVDGRCEIQIDLGNGRDSQINSALAAVERWLISIGMEAAKVRLDGRTYVLERRPEWSSVSAGRPEPIATNEVRPSP